LFARDGRVRCGSCRQIFDGLVNLTSLEALEAGVPPPLAETSEAELRARVEAMEAERAAQPSHGFAPLNWPMVPEVPVVPVPQVTSLPPEPATSAPVPVDATADAAATAVVASLEPEPQVVDANGAAAGDVIDESAAPRRTGWFWPVAATLAAVVLCGQALYGLRSEIAAYVPGVRPALVSACASIGCRVPPLQKPSALAIQASDLLILDQAKPHRVQLIVTLQNPSTMEIGYPAIDLALNDRFDHAVARRVFLPSDYLRGADAQKTVLPPSITTTVRIDLDLSELQAGGFGLTLMAAPQS
jgi:hypothetical protein